MDSKWKKIMTIFIIHGLLETQAGSAVERVTGCSVGSPQITIECDPGSTINITKGVCVRVPSCDAAYDPSLESQCYDSDRTAWWAPYCATKNLCDITCTGEVDCAGEWGDYSYAYAEYKCISNGKTEATRGPTSQAPVSDPVPLRGDVVRRKATLFKRIHQGGRLRNHAIKTKHGSSFVRCVSECNELDDCVSFNIGNGVCELNNQVVGGTGVSRDDFVKDEGLKYYEKQ